MTQEEVKKQKELYDLEQSKKKYINDLKKQLKEENDYLEAKVKNLQLQVAYYDYQAKLVSIEARIREQQIKQEETAKLEEVNKPSELVVKEENQQSVG